MLAVVGPSRAPTPQMSTMFSGRSFFVSAVAVGNNGFDPLGLAPDTKTLAALRNAELKHGRCVTIANPTPPAWFTNAEARAQIGDACRGCMAAPRGTASTTCESLQGWCGSHRRQWPHTYHLQRRDRPASGIVAKTTLRCLVNPRRSRADLSLLSLRYCPSWPLVQL